MMAANGPLTSVADELNIVSAAWSDMGATAETNASKASTAANAMQVYGSGTDTINGIATATGISQPPNSVCEYFCTAAGVWYAMTPGSGFSAQFPTVSTANALTAFAGGGQGSATPLTNVISRVTTVATGGDSVKLPASVPGMILTVINAAAANSMNVFPATGEAINALSANTAFAVAANKTVQFFCTVAGTWHSLLTA
jgi:hypothetical protein